MVFYSCENCGKKFSQKRYYTKHINKDPPCINETKLKENIGVNLNEKMNNKKENVDLFNFKKLEDIINTEIPTNSKKNKLGQYFTTNNELKEKVFEFILNKPSNILEPSIGQGDLIRFITDKIPNITFDMYEIDKTIKLLDKIKKDNVIYGDFMKQTIRKTYKTIIGNPPYVKTKKRNLYIDFTEKCYNLLDNNGELIFIVPSDFLKLTSASKLLNDMMTNGTFTHIFHPHNEKLFENASIDIIIFRYCKNNLIDKKILYNDKLLHITNSNGLITFGEQENNNSVMFKDYFDIYVGLVSGKEHVYKNDEIGNIEVINGEDKVDKYIYIENYPCDNEKINTYLLQHKKELIERKIRKFNENNWFEWGAPRNITTINSNLGKDCIYIYNLTRKQNVSFLGKVNYFGGGLIMLKPKKKCNLNNIVSYINSNIFRNNFIFSGRFKIGHRQVCNSYIPSEYL
jgi:adenine-specific DNA-methyltransferase